MYSICAAVLLTSVDFIGNEGSLFSKDKENTLNGNHCYDDYSDLGCFPNTSPWYSVLRPFPNPMNPKDIDAKIYLYTT